MDSFTQIALGATVGEAVLGKKIGNRAMLWGAVGGTIPDLDVITNVVTDEMTALAFHRGISHSFLFAFIAPLAIGYAADKLYKSGFYKRKDYKLWVMIGGMLFYALLALGVNIIPVVAGGSLYLPMVIGALVIGAGLFWWIWKGYFTAELEEVNASWKDWYWLLFWSIFTHPILDCCTTYGTQVFQPFSDYRVAFNNISVVDPIYTFPIIICLFLAARLMRNHSKRRLFNYVGLVLSTVYLFFGFYHKHQVDQLFEKTLAVENIEYSRYMTSPTIFNNVLWNCLAEGDSAYYHGMYSFYDKEKKVTMVNVFPKNHDWIAAHKEDHDMKTLQWFSNNYYNVIRRSDGKMQLNDLRFGVLGDKATEESDYVFRFILEEENGELKARQTRESREAIGTTMEKLWSRIWGRLE